MPTSSAIPAFASPTRTASGAAARILAMTGTSSSGPLPQLPPIASAPHSTRARTARSGETPIIVWPRGAEGIVLVSGVPGDGRLRVDPPDEALVAVERQAQAVAAEGVRQDDP